MSLFSNLAENDIFSGGIGLFLIGALTKLATPALRFSSAEFTRRMTVTREISTNDRLTFQVIAEFISKELPTMENHSSVSFGLSQDPKDNADRENKFNFRPSPGNYFVKYRNTVPGWESFFERFW